MEEFSQEKTRTLGYTFTRAVKEGWFLSIISPFTKNSLNYAAHTDRETNTHTHIYIYVPITFQLLLASHLENMKGYT